MDERVQVTVATYDTVVDDYVERNGQAPANLVAFREAFVSRVGPGGRVVDLGCGPGRDGRALRQAGLAVVGVDLSVGMLARAARAGVPVARGDVRRPPVRDAALDGVWSAASLLHVPSEDLSATCSAWRRILRRGGILGVSTSLGRGEGWDEGWEVSPHDSTTQRSRTGLRRWFVHHERDALVAELVAASFVVDSAVERESHRRWLQILATAA